MGMSDPIGWPFGYDHVRLSKDDFLRSERCRVVNEAPVHRILEPAALRWDGARPVSLDEGDIYHDVDGRDEALRVFIAPARLDERFGAAAAFTIGELGFGTGLNFAVAAQRFLRRSGGRLHYIAFEHAPPSSSDIARAAGFSGLPVHRELSRVLPPSISGWHRRSLAAGRVWLSLYFGDAFAGLADLASRSIRGVDAWFLDGFAPPRSQTIWAQKTCAAIARLSHAGTTVTTFSAAGVVKRALANAGFEVARIRQHGRKRHSVIGVIPGDSARATLPPQTVSVVGAGLAGCSVARALAERNVSVTVHDNAVAHGASAIPGAVLHARLLSDGSAAASLRAHAYAYATWFYSRCVGLTSTGALQLPGPNTPAERLHALGHVMPSDWIELVSRRDASDLAGIDIADSGLYFPGGAAIEGAALCRSLLDHPRIRFTSDAPEDGIRVLANGCAVTESLPDLEVAPLVGQVDRFDVDRLRLPVLADGYARPAGRFCWVGATYEYRPWPPAAATAANAERFRKLFGRAPGLSKGFFRGIRAITSDRTPVIGRAGPDTYVSTGHGSIGVASAALAGEWIASLICGECPPVSREVEALCRVGRFKERQQRRPNPFADGRRRER